MPRRQPERRRESRSTDRGRPGPVRRTRAPDVDEHALELREKDNPYSTIARRLELPRATDAHRAFLRAVHSRDVEERDRLVANERVRLDQLEVRVRRRDESEPDKLDRRLAAIENLRAALP